MKYRKPAILNASIVRAAICSSGPCGRPCSKRA